MISKIINSRSMWIALLALTSHTLMAGPLPTNNIKVLTDNKSNQSIQQKSSLDFPIPCSASALAAAIINANNSSNSTGEAYVTLSPYCIYSIVTPATGSDGLPAITGKVTLVGGPGTVIERNAAAANFRIISVNNGATLKLRNLVVQNGVTGGLGGGVLVNTGGTLYLQNVILQNNTANNGGGVSISTGARVFAIGSIFYQNKAISVGGGAFLVSGSLNIANSFFNYNQASINGGAVNVQPGGVTIVYSSNFGNNASGSLGGAFSNLGTLAINLSTIHFNAGSSGGGIATGNSNVTLFGTIIMNNVTSNCSPVNTIQGCLN